MADITDPEAIAFSEQYLRPMAEMLRWLQSSGNEMVGQWDGGVSGKFPNEPVGTTPVLDSNGVIHPYGGADANTIMTRLNGVLAVLNAANAMDGVLPATVRALGPASGPSGV